MMIHLLLVANAILIAMVGVLSLLYVDRPAGYVGAAGAWAFSALLLAGVPLTDPRRHDPWQEWSDADVLAEPPAIPGRDSREDPAEGEESDRNEVGGVVEGPQAGPGRPQPDPGH
jgi:hypothetical protein